MKPEDLLNKQIAEESQVASYIFYGSDLERAYQSALDFAKGLEISPFDIVEVEPESDEKNSKGEIKIGQIRNLIRQINLTPGQGKYKLAIIKNVDKISTEAANTLLKTLEEPVKSSFIILLSADLKLIPTIISRCQIVRLSDIDQSQDEKVVNDLFGIEKDNLAKAFSAVANLSASDEMGDHFERAFLDLQKKLIADPKIETVERIKALFLAKKNFYLTTNKKLVLENLILSLSQ